MGQSGQSKNRPMKKPMIIPFKPPMFKPPVMKPPTFMPPSVMKPPPPMKPMQQNMGGMQKPQSMGGGMPQTGPTNQTVAQPGQPQAAQPQVAQPQVAQPQAVKPQVVQPQVAQPQVVKPQVAQPQVVLPQVAQPQAIQPTVTVISPQGQILSPQMLGSTMSIHPIQQIQPLLPTAVSPQPLLNLASPEMSLLHYQLSHPLLHEDSRKEKLHLTVGWPGVTCPPSTTPLENSRIAMLTGLPLETVERLSNEFLKLTDGSGTLDKSKFQALVLQTLFGNPMMTVNRFADSMFSSFDVDQTGRMEFPEFVRAYKELLAENQAYKSGI